MQLKGAFFLGALAAFFGAVDAAKSGYQHGRSALSLEQVLISHPQQALMSLLRQATDASAPDPSISSLAAIAASLSQDHSTTPSSVEQIKTLVQGLEDALYDEFKTTQTGINNVSGFDACITEMNSDMTKCNSSSTSHSSNSEYQTCMTEWTQLNQSYTTCRSVEDEYNKTRTIICAEYENISWDAPFNWRHCPENDHFTGTYEQYLQRSVDRLYVLRSLRENCSTATDRWSNKTDLCDAEQIVLDEKWQNCSSLINNTGNCTDYECRKSSCSEFDQCWAGQLGAFNGTIHLAYGLETSLHAQWRALQRIECLLDVLDAQETDNQTHMLEVCIAKRHTVPSNLTIANYTPPTKPNCSTAPQPDGCPA